MEPADSFMTCVLKINTAAPGWQKTMMKVLGNMHGVNSFRMGKNGKVLVSGKVTPTLLLKVLGKAGKKAELIWWQFGECSSNLFLPANNQYLTMHGQYGNGNMSGYGRGYYNGHAYGYGATNGGYEGGYFIGYGENNYYQGGDGGNSLLDNSPCPWQAYPADCHKKKVVINQKSEREVQPACCTIM